MTERKGEVRPTPSLEDRGQTVVHKGTRDCPILEPHSRQSCGIVQARERRQAEADAAERARRGG
ncbi:MAG: hypothetical protein H0T44_13740 [Gemmatimonadales bacterium]|nr:hypothetical protein [Gemmatimonadales bacterium]MDQ3426399.1 hypothetical protein [Gemmatimonadota bacterium]